MIIEQVNSRNKEESLKFLKKEWKQFNKENNYSYDTERYECISLDENKIVGFGDLKIIGGTAYMGELIVDKKFRKKGIGKMIITHLEEYAKKKNCHRFFLETSEKHTDAVRFYKRNGFTELARLPNHKFGFEWYIFSKELNK
ncbi:MAG TPA: GNAT family N-acetyltransferase [Candidatus Nanoarchaeia archaeon]|nr:GNAT family N-acetyltransferase [Candidatus Nanoarchaeia archaeon]